MSVLQTDSIRYLWLFVPFQIHPAKAPSPIIVTHEFITLQKSHCYLIYNVDQVTIQKRAELHILSRYTHFQRTPVCECKVKHLFYYHQRNRCFLNFFIAFCSPLDGDSMYFSYQADFGNGLSFSSLHFPHGRLLRRQTVLFVIP